jgi:hypothetical protein
MQGFWEPALEHHAKMLLTIDAKILGNPTPITDVDVEWPELVDDPIGRATWINTLGQAMAASVRTRVKLGQPDLSGQELEDEVQAVLKENGLGQQAPSGFGVPGLNPDTGQPALLHPVTGEALPVPPQPTPNPTNPSDRTAA